MASSQTIRLYKSRMNILNCLDKYQNYIDGEGYEGNTSGYDISKYKEFNLKDINTMISNGDGHSLDMLLKQKNGNKQVLVHYQLDTLTDKKIQNHKIGLFLDHSLVDQSAQFTRDDDLIIISNEEPTQNITESLEKIWKNEGIYIRVIGIDRLQYNVLDHMMVPPHRVLNDEEKAEIQKKYNITQDSQLPDISRFSTVAQLIGLRPGQYCEIFRSSKTAIRTRFYRICS